MMNSWNICIHWTRKEYVKLHLMDPIPKWKQQKKERENTLWGEYIYIFRLLGKGWQNLTQKHNKQVKLQNSSISHILKEYLWNPYHHKFVDRKEVLQIDTKKTNWSKHIIFTATNPSFMSTKHPRWWHGHITNANLVIWCYVRIVILNRMRSGI
jgi:HrpA-like RNA helicase